jgi:phospholipid/cholesterol/gamma-HCH transport system substrate-binding protein
MTMSRAFRLGVFIVVALLLFGAGVFWIGEKHFLFSSTYRLSAEFPNVAGLNGGAEVRVGGIHEGTVRQIQLPVRPTDKVHVVMELADGTRSVIKNDSVATIRSEGLVGDKFIEISFGSEQAPQSQGWRHNSWRAPTAAFGSAQQDERTARHHQRSNR